MRIRKHAGRWLLLTALLAAAFNRQLPAQAANLPDPAGPGTSAIAPAGCFPTQHIFTQNTAQPILDFTALTSTIHISGLPQQMWDVQVRTAISHTYPNDLEVYLIQPDSFGERITLTTHNGGGAHNIFANTLWSDQAPFGITEITHFSDNVNLPYLIPEGALGGVDTHLANGDWKLVVKDTALGDTGTLNGWTLYITTLDGDPGGKSASPNYATPENIPDGGTFTSTVQVSGLGSITDGVSLYSFIRHSASGDLRLTLTSPTGLTTTLTNGRGYTSTDLFDGTNWSDSAFFPVTDAPYDSGPLDQAQPEGAMRHFAGSDPNGTWTLAATDLNNNGQTGTVDGWQLVVNDAECSALFLPTVRR